MVIMTKNKRQEEKKTKMKKKERPVIIYTQDIQKKEMTWKLSLA